jgi:hypothetical protein
MILRDAKAAYHMSEIKVCYMVFTTLHARQRSFAHWPHIVNKYAIAFNSRNTGQPLSNF